MVIVAHTSRMDPPTKRHEKAAYGDTPRPLAHFFQHAQNLIQSVRFVNNLFINR